MSFPGGFWKGLRAWLEPRRAPFIPPVPTPRPDEYKIYTRAHDRETSLAELDTALGPLSAADKKTFEASKAACLIGLAEWQALANAKALIWRQKVAISGTRAERVDTCITVLLDLSGSMSGQRIMIVKGVLEVVGSVPEALGARYEILGFTTARWQGGRPRLEWINAGKPQWPGRLNEVLHVVIADADVRESARLARLDQLLRPDLLKENIDGEAIEWASARLMTRRAKRRALIVISDGAPVDDATLAANGTDYLDRHLKTVIAVLRSQGEIELFGIGIDFSPARYYERARTVITPDELLDAFFDVLAEIMARRPADGRAPRSASFGDDLEPSDRPI